MLEIRGLKKTYKPKRGVPVNALDNISLKLPQKGMVVILGKSGSGKSTLLNVLGGLDRYDHGEIIIKGVSSKTFKQSHFDSYRNTYVGFIFQEYNLLEDFNVGANVALAIELQNRKATDQEINSILKEVDLEGYGNRKPNELSGGQRQRVAIARALVKNPEIIMADEPTGALDSNTGKQIFDTLKKLSKDKLVIVVSHDREYAEGYADRIIELSDGKVISDVELCQEEALQDEGLPQALVYEGNTIQIPSGYHLTEEDRLAINEYISTLGSSLNISVVYKEENSRRFTATNESKISSEGSSPFKLIKSKLPLKNAFKIGASGLKYKKVRLALTILLSFVAFTLFALSDTFASYNHVKTCTESIVDSQITYASMVKAKKLGKGAGEYWDNYGYHISKEELNNISEASDIDVTGVYIPSGNDLSFYSNIDGKVLSNESMAQLYATSFSGLAEVTKETLASMGYVLVAGHLPDGTKDEIAISSYIFETFKQTKYTDGQTEKDSKGYDKLKYSTINSYEDMLGKTLSINNKEYTISGIVDVKLDFERYKVLLDSEQNSSTSDALLSYALLNEFRYISDYSLCRAMMVGSGYVDSLVASYPDVASLSHSYINFHCDTLDINPQYIGRLSDIPNEKIIWINGARTSLGEKEIVVSSDLIYYSDKIGETTGVDFAELVGDTSLTMNGYSQISRKSYDEGGYTVVGVVDNFNTKSNLYCSVIGSDSFYNSFATDDDGIYKYVIGAMPEEKSQIKSLVSYCYNNGSNTNIRYQLQNSVTYELDTVNSALKELSKVFLYIGLGFAVFASLMLANFIGTSISYKKHEIGILRAIGSRSNDVFRIFFAESFIIAMTNFLLSSIGTFVVASIINGKLRNSLGLLITLLHFGPRQIMLLLAVSIGTAFIASFLPVRKIASKRPIDAIRNR